MKLKKYNVILTKWSDILPGYCGYYRMYYRRGWDGRWFTETGNTSIDGGNTQLSPDEMEEFRTIYEEITKRWPCGCNYNMERDIKSYQAEIPGNPSTHLLETEGTLLRFLVSINLLYGNADYPIRIYIYRKVPTAEDSSGDVVDAHWTITDPITYQLIRKYDNEAFEIYQIHNLTPLDGEASNFQIAHGFVCIREANKNYVLQNLGYRNIKELQETDGNNWEITLVSHYFKLHFEHYLTGPVGLTQEEAIHAICKLSGYPVAKGV